MANELRPLSLGELLDRCFFLYRKNFLLFACIAALPHLVLLAFQFAGIGLQSAKILTGFGAAILWTLFLMAISLGVVAASQGATVVAVSQVHLGRPASIAESFGGIKGRVFYLALIMIGYGIGIAVGLVLLIVPGVILALMWALTIPVAVIEDKGLADSLSRSAELTKGHRGRVFVIYLLFLVLWYALYLAWEIPILAAIGFMAQNPAHRMTTVPIWTQIAIPLGNFLSQVLVSPLMTIGFSLLYYDERVRKEAFDLQHMMATLDEGQAGTVPAIGA